MVLDTSYDTHFGFHSHTVPTRPRNLTVNANGPNAIMVSWDEPAQPNGNPYYLVQYIKRDEMSEWASNKTMGRSFDIEGLEVNTGE